MDIYEIYFFAAGSFNINEVLPIDIDKDVSNTVITVNESVLFSKPTDVLRPSNTFFLSQVNYNSIVEFELLF